MRNMMFTGYSDDGSPSLKKIFLLIFVFVVFCGIVSAPVNITVEKTAITPEDNEINYASNTIDSTNKGIFMNFNDLPEGDYNVTINQIPTPGNEQWTIDSNLTEGAFNVTIDFHYNETLLPMGSFENTLYMLYYNESSSTWVPLSSIVDTINNIITVQLDHFTNFSPSSNMTVNGTDITEEFISRGSQGAPLLMLNFTNNGTSDDNITQMIITSKNDNNSDIGGVMLCGDDGDGEFDGESDCAPPIDETTFLSNETGANATFSNLSVNISANNSTIIYVVYSNISTSAVINNTLDALIPVNGITMANSGNNTGEIDPYGNTTITPGLLNTEIDMNLYDGTILILPDASNSSAGENYTDDLDESPLSVFQAMMNSSINAIQLFVNHTSSGSETYSIDADDNNETGWSPGPGAPGFDLEIITDGGSGNVTVLCWNATANFTLSPENTSNCYNIVNVTYNNTGAQGEIVLDYDPPQGAFVSKYDKSWVYLKVPETPRAAFVDIYTLPALSTPNASLNFGTAREVYIVSRVEIDNPSDSNKNITNTSVLLDTDKPLLEFAEKQHHEDILSIENIYISNDTTRLNWTLNTTEPDNFIDIYTWLFDRTDVDYGYNASVAVDGYEFNGLGNQTLTIVINLYNNSNADGLHVHVSRYGWNDAPPFLTANFTNISSDNFSDCSNCGEEANCNIEDPDNGTYTIVLNISVNASSPSMYRPMVEIEASKKIAEYNVNSNTVTNTTLAGNFTITSDNAQWDVRRAIKYESRFHAILTNGTNVINGTVTYAFSTNTTKPLTRIEIDDFDTTVWTDETGYYAIYVPNGTYEINAGRDRPDAMQQFEGIVINATQNATVNFTLQNGSVLTGSVFNASTNESMNETCVRVKNESWNSETDTNDMGYYRIHVPASGDYTLELCNYDTDDFSISNIGQGNGFVYNFLAYPQRPELGFIDYYRIHAPNEPNVTVNFGTSREVYISSTAYIHTSDMVGGNVTNTSVRLETTIPLQGFRDVGDGVLSLRNNYISNDTTSINWTLREIGKSDGIDVNAERLERDEVNFGFNTTVKVDKFNFNGVDTQAVSVNVTIYDDSNIDNLEVRIRRGKEVGSLSYIDVNVTDPSGPGDMYNESDRVEWHIKNPENGNYTFSANMSINAIGNVKYRPDVEVVAMQNLPCHKVDGNEITNSTLVGNFTVKSNSSKWILCRSNEYNIEFRSIVTNTTEWINGTINYTFLTNTDIPITSISLCNESIGCYEVYTGDSGYYIAYVSSGTYDVCAGSDRSDAMQNGTDSILANLTCDLTLQNGSVIAGSVFNATTNESMNNTKVMLWNSSWEQTVEINNHGYYNMHVPVSGDYTLGLKNYLSNQRDISNIGQGNCSVHNLLASVDTSAPVITAYSINPKVVINGSNVSLSMNVTDFNLDKTWVIVKPPGLPQVSLYPPASYAANITGRHNVTFYANDSAGNEVNVSDYFISEKGMQFNSSSIYYNGTGLNVTLRAYFNGSLITWNQSIGNVVLTIANYTYDLEFSTFNNSLIVLLKGVNLSENNNRVIGFDRLTSVLDYLVTYVVNNSYEIENATLNLGYSGTVYGNKDYLGVYKCSNWNFSERSYSGNWEKLTDVINDTDNERFLLNVSNLSAFSIKQEPYCGDGVINKAGEECDDSDFGGKTCESYGYDYGSLSCINCKISTSGCKYSGGNGGGGGGGPAYGAKPKPSCFDGIKNCHSGGCEEGIDCGGPCKPCPSCTDGIQNQGEEGIDCGGPCLPCTVTTTTTIVTTTSTTTAIVITTTVLETTTTAIETTTTTTPTEEKEFLWNWVIVAIIIIVAVSLYTRKKKVKKKPKKVKKEKPEGKEKAKTRKGGGLIAKVKKKKKAKKPKLEREKVKEWWR